MFNLITAIVACILSLVQISASYYHYRKSLPELGKTIPIHFGCDGTPDNFADSSKLKIYPIMAVVFGILTVALGAFMPFPSDIGIVLVMACSGALILVTQYYAVEISRRRAEKLPPLLFYSLLVLMFACTILLVVLSILFTPKSK